MMEMAVYKDNATGTWRVIYRFTNWKGERKQTQKRGFATKREAQAWEHEVMLKQNSKLDMTFASFFELYEADKKQRVKESTWESKSHVIRTKILPYFGNRKIAEIEAKDIIAWQNELMAYQDEKGKPYSADYLKTIHAQLTAIFNHAVNFYNLPYNPARRAGTMGNEIPKEMDFWTKEEYLKFSEAMMDADQFDLAIRRMASGYESFYTDIYEDIVKYDNKNLIEESSKLFKVDYQGYGFAQYADITLDESFGSRNADEYISKALPMYCEKMIDFKEKTPQFWKGEDVPKNARKLFYIVRIKTSFSLKEGMEPCVRYRERDILRTENIFAIDNNHNIKDRGWTILATSDIYDKKTDKYYSKYRDINGKIVAAAVTVSLGKDDYLLFKERYNIRYIEILDGCYFG